ncbi:MAG: hypothetical protein ABIR78_09110 [Ferruginibacter sp.]
MIAKIKYFLFILLISFCHCSTVNTKNIKSHFGQSQVLKLEMILNAFGVESDGFPTINATIDFVSDSSLCEVSYYEPWLKQKQYSFSKQELDTLRTLLTSSDLKKIKKEYNEGPTDQPTSITTIYTTQDTFKIKDYGLQAEFPLPELYRIVYNLKRNFR